MNIVVDPRLGARKYSVALVSRKAYLTIRDGDSAEGSMTELAYTEHGFLPIGGYSVWYGIVGEPSSRPTVVVVHGGPGLPHDYLEPVSAVAAGGRRVVFYDQLGCGNSDRPDEASLWSVDLFVEELAALVRQLRLDRFHLFGHSWGGALAMEYALRHPIGPVSLMLADTFPSMPRLRAEWARLRSGMPGWVQEVLSRHERAGTTSDPEYQAAFEEFFYRRHVCRVDPQPECVPRAFSKAGGQVYNAMWGPSWFEVTGKLRDWDVTPRLNRIVAPALILVGRHDQCTPVLAELLKPGIPRSELAIFENSSHLPYIEEPERFHQVVTEFLERVESSTSSSP